MMEGKVQLAHFILVVLGHDAVNSCVESEGSTGRTLLMCAAELTHCSARACFMQLLLWRGADVERRDEAGRTALSLASQHGDLDAVRLLVVNGDVVQFLLGQEKQKHLAVTLADSVEELASWRAKNCAKIGYCGFPRGIRRLLCKQSVSDLFLTERVICNPYALEHDEEKQFKGHRKCPSSVFLPSAQLSIPDQASKNPVFASKTRFFPAWMRRGQSSHFNSTLNTNRSFWKWMTPKMVLNGINHASESQINLLVPDKDAFDNAQIPSSSAEELPFTDNVVRNHWFLEEGSGNFFGSGRIEMHDISLSSKRKLYRQVHAPKSNKNSFRLLAQCNQDSVRTTCVWSTPVTHFPRDKTFSQRRLRGRSAVTVI